MMLTQCNGFAFFNPCRVGPLANLLVPCDAQHALVVDHVALALDERVFAQIAQLVVLCDAQHTLDVDHVSLALDDCVFARIA